MVRLVCVDVREKDGSLRSLRGLPVAGAQRATDAL